MDGFVVSFERGLVPDGCEVGMDGFWVETCVCGPPGVYCALYCVDVVGVVLLDGLVCEGELMNGEVFAGALF